MPVLCRCGRKHDQAGACTAPEFVLAKVSYKNWILTIGEMGKTINGTDYPVTKYLQWSGIAGDWKSRKWLLSEHMTTSELVQTAFLAALTAEEHECREEFKYKGVALYGHHFHIDALVELCEQGKFDVRQEPIKPVNCCEKHYLAGSDNGEACSGKWLGDK